MTKPLAGIRVLDLSRVLAGPWCTQLLADLGADVVKIERPGQGDDTRHWGPPFLTAEDGTDLSAAYYHACNRGKRSLAVDFEDPEALERVRALAAEADVIIENFKVGGLRRFGLDHQSVQALNPGAVYCSITGFGQTGPYAPRAGYGSIGEAMGGIRNLAGDPSTPPSRVGLSIGVTRLVMRMLSQEMAVASRAVPTVVYVALTADEDWSAAQDVAGVLRERGVAAEVAVSRSSPSCRCSSQFEAVCLSIET